MLCGHQCFRRRKLGTSRWSGLRNPVCSCNWSTQCCLRDSRGQRVPHRGKRLNTLGEGLRVIDLPFTVGGDFNLAGEVLESCLAASRIACAHRCAKSTVRLRAGTERAKGGSSTSSWCRRSCTLCQGRGGGRQPHSHTHPPGVRRLPCLKATWVCPAPNGCTSRPFEETPELRCGARHGDMVSTCKRAAPLGRTALDEVAMRCGRTVETDVFGRHDLADEEKYAGRVAVPTTRQQQLSVRRAPGPAAGGAVCATD